MPSWSTSLILPANSVESPPCKGSCDNPRLVFFFFPLNNNDASFVIQMSPSFRVPTVCLADRSHSSALRERRHIVVGIQRLERLAVLFSPLFLLSPSLLFNYFSHTFTKGRRLSETPQVIQKSWVEGSGGGTKKNPSSNNLICPAVLCPQWWGWKKKGTAKKPVTPTMCRGRENVGGAADTLHTRSSRGGVSGCTNRVCVYADSPHNLATDTLCWWADLWLSGDSLFSSFITTREGKKQ